VQEFLNNSVEDAGAKSATKHIRKEENKIITLRSDNGKRFNIDDKKMKNSLGLKTIFERTKTMNGKLSIGSKLDTRTSLF
jgi:signal transduction histidine kinase